MAQQTQPTQNQGQFEQGSQQSQSTQGGELATQSQQGQLGRQPGQQQQMTQQPGQQKQGRQSQGLALRDVETPEQRQAIESIERSIQVCGWCADQCIEKADQMMVQCIKLCEDVAELGEATLAMLPRNSQFSQPVLQTFQQAAQACAQECGQHQDAHCQECAQVLTQTVDAIQGLLATTGGQGGMQQPGLGQTGMQQGGL